MEAQNCRRKNKQHIYQKAFIEIHFWICLCISKPKFTNFPYKRV